MRDNRTAKKLLLLVVLISILGVGIGRVAEDLFLASASYADDPATPAPTVNLVLPMATNSVETHGQPPRETAQAIRPPAPETPARNGFAPGPPPGAFTPPQRC